MDHHLDSKQRIVPAIFDAIRRSAFIIADVSEERPNVYYELGYAHALGKTVIVTAQEGAKLHFDIFDVQAQFWGSQTELQRKLLARINPRPGSDAALGETLK